MIDHETRAAMYVTRDCLVVSIQEELHMEALQSIQEDILTSVYEKGIKGVIIDVSGVAIIDRLIARKLFDSSNMASLLGTEAVITGLRPGVVASLVDLEFEQGDVTTAIDLEEGFRILERVLKIKAEPDEPELNKPGPGNKDQEEEKSLLEETEIGEE